MSPSKKTISRSAESRGLKKWIALAFGPGRTAVLIALLLAGFGIVWFLTWRFVKDHVYASPRYTVSVDQIEVTPKPAWIQTDVRGDAFLAASRPDRRLSSLDPDLRDRIGNAFVLQPWVAHVDVHVKSLAPARVEVELVYRKPVCFVEVGAELLPVDIHGVLLPSADFSPLEKAMYPCLTGINSRPMGAVGQAWGDVRVNDGAAIAAAIESVWRRLKLYRIVPTAIDAPPVTYDIYTQAGSRIVWGLPPNSQAPASEPAPEDKVARLVQYAEQHGGIDGPTGKHTIEIHSLPPAPASGPAKPVTQAK